MANEAEIINNPTSTPEEASTGYQRQNTLAVAARVGMDETVVVGGTGECTLQVSGPVDVNGVLYTIQSAVTFTIPTAGRYFIYVGGSGDNLTPTLSTDSGSFDYDKNARYTSGGYRILNKIIYYDGTTAFISKLSTPFEENNKFLDIDEPEETSITSGSTWTARKSKYYKIIVTAKGGNGGSSTTSRRGGGGGGAGLTGIARIYIEAGDTWTAVFGTSSGGNTTISDGTTTLTAQNGYNGSNDVVSGGGGAGGSTSSGFDLSFSGGDGHHVDYYGVSDAVSSAGNGGSSYYGGGGRGSVSDSNGFDGQAYGSGGGGSSSFAGSSRTGGSGSSGLIRIIG